MIGGATTVLRKFLGVGLINTLVGYAVILLCLSLGAGDYAANAAGYAVGLMLSYNLNRRWTFEIDTPPTLLEAGRFGLAALAAYSVNLIVIYLARSIGMVASPLAQAVALLSYATTFFLLSRFMVFAPIKAHPLKWANWNACYPELALIFASIVTWLCIHQIRLSHDIFWQFWIARQLLGDARLYADIWEVNPPLWFWSAMPIEWIAERMLISWQPIFFGFVLALGASSAWLVATVTAQPRPRDKLGLMLFLFWIVSIVPLSDIGQREQLALMASLPYASLIARRRTGGDAPFTLAIAVGVFGAYGFALKHYFVLIPIVLELWLALRLKWAWRPWRPELAVLAVLAVAYAVCVVSFTPEFFSIMVPMVQVAYSGFESPTLTLLLQPWVVFWLGAIAFLQLYRRERRTFETREAEAFFEVLPILAACFAFAYFVQHKGWYYHTIPITTILAIAIGLHLTRMGSSRMLPIAIGLALLALPASTALTPRPERQPIVKVSAKLLGSLPVGEPVFIGSVAPRLAWPTTEQRKLVWTSRAFTLWMLPAIAEGELIGPNTPELRSLANTVLTATSEDIRCHPPTQIIIQRGLNVREQSRAFNVRDFLFRDTQLRRFLDDHYAEQPPTPLVYVYLRKGPIEGISNSACRTIR